MKSMICFDVDGTLIDFETHQMSKQTLSTLHQLQANGHKVIIATGRSMMLLKLSGLLELFKWDGVVANNGQCAYDEKHQPLFIDAMSPESVDRVVKICKQENLQYCFETESSWFYEGEVTPIMKEVHQMFQEALPPVGKYENQTIVMMLVYAPLDYNYALFEAIEDIYVAKGVIAYADLGLKGSNKASGIERLKQYLKMEHVIAFGDGNNDLEMIECANIGIAMGNATVELKEKADYITLDCNQEGITAACQHFGLI